MGTYINIGNEGFTRARRGEYVDKSGLIGVVNRTIGTEMSFTCVTRSRRFGKSMAAKMLAAYYDQSCDSRKLFEDLEIAGDPTFEEHLNKYPVIYIDMTEFVTRFRDETIISHIQQELKQDVMACYPQVTVSDDDDLMACLIKTVQKSGQQFILFIDEWDAICREYPPAVVDRYVDLMRRMFKGVNAVSVFAAVYLTGILPIKKYRTQSALNNFAEYSMIEPRRMARYFGFTKDEVRSLAAKYGMDFAELEKWYDGYQIGDELSMFNPNSVMQALDTGRCRSFWAATGAYELVADYIKMNFEGLKDDIIRMLAGGRCVVDPTGFNNDLAVVNNRDDVLTVLIHLGYLSYDWVESECYIPNREVAGEMEKAVRDTGWTPVVTALKQSRELLQATIDGDADTVARMVDSVHDEDTSILAYNNENSLACVLAIAYYYAKNDYIVHREYATGKGFADLVMLPRKNVQKPALVVELKYRKDAEAAIAQIKQKNYPAKVADYTGDILLVGISYDRETKQHTCHIEQFTK